MIEATFAAMSAIFASMPATPTPTPTVDPNLVTPGPWGFGIMVGIVAFVVVLIWDMQRRVRRVRYRDEVRAELDAEQTQRAAEAGGKEQPGVDPTDPESGSRQRGTPPEV